MKKLIYVILFACLSSTVMAANVDEGFELTDADAFSLTIEDIVRDALTKNLKSKITAYHYSYPNKSLQDFKEYMASAHGSHLSAYFAEFNDAPRLIAELLEKENVPFIWQQCIEERQAYLSLAALTGISIGLRLL